MFRELFRERQKLLRPKHQFLCSGGLTGITFPPANTPEHNFYLVRERKIISPWISPNLLWGSPGVGHPPVLFRADKFERNGEHYFAKTTISRRKLLICEENYLSAKKKAGSKSKKLGPKSKKVGSKSKLLICENYYFAKKLPNCKITILQRKLLFCEENYYFAKKITNL